MPSSRGGGFLAAERFHLAYKDGAVDPNVRRRDWTAGRQRESPSLHLGGRQRSDTSPTEMSNPSLSRSMKSSENPASVLRHPAGQPSKPQQPYIVAFPHTRSNMPSAKSKNIATMHSSMNHGCIQETAARAARQVGTCTTNVRQSVRQECHSMNSNNGSGDDKMFFTVFAPENNSLGQSQSTETSVHEPTKQKTIPQPQKNRFRQPLQGAQPEPQQRHRRSTAVQQQQQPRLSTHRPSGIRSPEPVVRMVSGMQQQQDSDSQEDVRRPRGTYEARDGSDSPPPEETSLDDFNMLRERRLLLFQRDGQDDMVPKAQFTRVLGELVVQDETIQNLKRELSLMKKTLDVTTHELNTTRDACQRNMKTLTDLRAKSLAERKTLEEKLGKATHENKALSSKMSSLQVESTRLRAQVRNYSKVEQAREVTPPSSKRMENPKYNHKPSIQEPVSDDSTLIVSLRAEMVELRSQLAEAKEVQLHLKTSHDNAQRSLLDKSEVTRLQGEVTRLEKQLEKAEHQVAELREQQEKERTDQAAQLQAGQSSSEESAATSAAAAKSNEALMTAQRALEEAQARENVLAAQLERVNKELASAKRKGEIIRIEANAREQQMQREIKQLEQDVSERNKKSENDVKIRDIEISSLKAEVTRLSQKLESALQEHLAKEAECTKERNNLEDELAHSKGAVQVLQNKLSALDDRLADVEAEAESLRGQNKSEARGNGPNFSFSRLLDMTGMNGEEKRGSPMSVETDADDLENAEKISRWQHQLKRSRANESVLASEVTILRELASNVRSQADFDRLKFMENESVLKREMEKLQSRLAELECEKKLTAAKLEVLSRNEDELLRSKAREQSLLNEIFELKTKLEILETQIKEERFRADEESRMSRDAKEMSSEQIEKLQKELNEAVREKEGTEKGLKLKLADMESRLKFAQQQGRQLSRVVAEDGTEKRLRSDLKNLQAKLKEAQKQVLEVQKKADDNAKKHEAVVTKLRNELALMRARRVAEQKLEMREREFESTNSSPMGSPDRSMSVACTPLRVSFSSDGSVGTKSNEFNTPPTGQRRMPKDVISPPKGTVRKRAEVLNNVPGGEVTKPNDTEGSPNTRSPPYTPVRNVRSQTQPHVIVVSPADPSVPTPGDNGDQSVSTEVTFQPFPLPLSSSTVPHMPSTHPFSGYVSSTPHFSHPVQVMEYVPHDLVSLGSGTSLRSSSPRKGVGAVPVGCDDAVSLVHFEETVLSPPVSKQLDVAGFHRKLMESNKRLVNANSKLKGLVKASDDIMAEQVRIRGTCNDLLTRVETQSTHVSQEEDDEEDECVIPERTYHVVQDGDTRRCLV